MSQSVDVNYEIATIANGETNSNWVNFKGKQLVAIVFPAALTSASVKYNGRYLSTGNGNTITQKNTPGTDYSTSFVASKAVPLDVDVFCGWGQIQIVAASAEGGAREIVLITRPVS
jgi:hypothetical protein